MQLELYDTINETSPQVKPIAKLFISISIVDSIFYPKNSNEFEVGLKYYFGESQNLPLNSNGNHSGLNAVGRYSDLKYRNKISFWNFPLDFFLYFSSITFSTPMPLNILFWNSPM